MGTNQPQRLIDLERRLRSWETLAEDGKPDDRDARYRRIDSYLRGYHDGDDSDEQGVKMGDEWYPAIPLVWMVIDMLLPKILNQPVDPQVVPEQDSPFYQPVDSPFMRYKRDNGLATRSDADAAAEMLNAAVEYYTEKVDLEGKNTDAWRGAAWFGDYFVYDSDENGKPAAIPTHPRCITIDPDAVELEDARFVVVETDQTLGWVQENYPEYGDLVKPNSADDRKDIGKADALDPRDNNVKVECWFEKMLDTRVKTEAVQTDDPGEYQEYLETGEWEVVEVTYQTLENGAAVPLWTLEREYEDHATPGGWVKHVRCNNIVLADDLPVSESGKLPLHHYRLYKVPNSFWSMGVIDLIQDLNVIYDDTLKNCLDDIEQNGPANFWRGAELESDVDSVNDSRTKNYEVKGGDPSQPLGNYLMHVPAGETSQSALRILDVVRQLVEMITGQVDPRTSAGPLREASGAMVKEMEDGSHERLGQQQQLNAKNQRDIVRNWCYLLIENETDARGYRRKNSQGRSFFRFKPSIFGSKDFDFHFDVITGDAAAVPRKTNERAQWYSALMAEVMQLPPQLAEWRIDISGAPNGHELKQLLSEFRQSQQQEQQGPNEVEVETAKNVQQSLADFLEGLGKDNDQPNHIKAAALSALNQWAATGQVPDLTQLTTLLMQTPNQSMLPQGSGLLAQQGQYYA